METPETIKKDEPNYRPDAWQEYTLSELGEWVHLLAKRALMRSPEAREKALKDLQDADAYHAMMGSHLAAVREKLGG